MEKSSLIKKIYRKILRIMPEKAALYLIYFRGYKKKLNLKNPHTWGEKIQWLKLYGGLEEVTEYVDKYDVRKYVSEQIGDEYLNELYGVYDNYSEINFDELPNEFVIKSTNGSGTLMIVKDKKKIDYKKLKRTVNNWLKDDYYREKKEPQYKNIRNRIIVEKYLENKNNGLNDYKFYCFNGKVEFYGVFYDRYTDKSIDFYDKNGKKLNGVNCCHIKNSLNVEPYNKNIKKMIELSEILSKPFTEVRVDFYCVNNNIIFGELTFTDGAGSDPWYPYEFDLKIANYIPLKKIVKK